MFGLRGACDRCRPGHHAHTIRAKKGAGVHCSILSLPPPHLFFVLIFKSLFPVVGCGALILLVLGSQVVHVTLSLGEQCLFLPIQLLLILGVSGGDHLLSPSRLLSHSLQEWSKQILVNVRLTPLDRISFKQIATQDMNPTGVSSP